MGELFGTDGIRGKAGVYPLDRATVWRVGFCLTRYLATDGRRPLIMIGRDTRESGPGMEDLVRDAVRSAGGEPEICGVLSTPAVALLAARTGAHAGVMLSASHNPYQDNGIKIFSSNGIKFNDAIEERLEQRILSSAETAAAACDSTETSSAARLLQSVPRYREAYIDFLRGCLSPGFTLEGKRLAVDCAHGSLFSIAPSFLRALGADVIALHCDPDGRNINSRCGALFPESLQAEVLATEADLGIAFDGDGDRAIFVDREGKVRDGDDVLYLFAGQTSFADAPRVIVGTVMTNLGLEIALAASGIRLVRTAVGDRYVLEEMLKVGAILGGEQSGHVILSRLAHTGDGLLTALKVLEVLSKAGERLEKLCGSFTRLPQVLLSIPVSEKIPFEEIAGLKEMEASWREKLGPRSRIILRYSGTEKVARVMVEGESDETVRSAAHALASVFQPSRVRDNPS